MTPLHRLALAAVAVATAPQIARAEGPPLSSVQVYCQPGSLNNCFAFAMTSADGHLTYYLQNLQGSLEAGGSPFGITRISIEDFATNEHTGPTLHYLTTTPSGELMYGPFFTTEGHVRRDEANLYEDSNALSYLQRVYLATSGAIYGCATPYTGPDADNLQRAMSIAQTCLPTGLDGWLRFDFTAFLYDNSGNLIRPGSFEDLYVNIQGCAVNIGALSGASAGVGTNCATNISYADLRAGFTTVPEPTSLALLGTGLAGTGLVGRRRRRAAEA